MYIAFALLFAYLLVSRRRLRKRLQRLEKGLHAELAKSRTLAEQHHRWSSLLAPLTLRAPLPLFQTATLDLEAIEQIVCHLLQHRPRRVLLLGGSPLALLCGYLAEEVICIEQNPTLVEQLKQNAALHAVPLQVEHRPLKLHTSPWYSGDFPATDLLIVDGPSPFIGEGVRTPAPIEQARTAVLTAADERTLDGWRSRSSDREERRTGTLAWIT